jgi:hypothetical protein
MLSTLVLVANGCSTQTSVNTEQIQQRQSNLDKLLAQKNIYAIYRTVEPTKFGLKNSSVATSFYKSDTDWINAKAQAGQVPIMYLSAYRFSQNSQTDAALQMYAHARIHAFLDAKSCKKDPRFPWYDLLESSFQELSILRHQNSLAYIRYANEALSQDKTIRSTTSPAWYCEVVLNDNIRPKEEAYAARDKQIQAMQKDNDELLSQQSVK